MNTFLNWTAFVVLAWCVTAGCGWWPGPIAVMTDAVSRHRNRWSDDQDIDEDTPAADVMTPEAPGGLGRTVRLQQPLQGPRPIADLRRELAAHTDAEDDEDLDDEDDPDDEDEQDDLPRRDWVRLQLLAGRRPGWIDEHGARAYDCHPRTIAREREALTNRNSRRTMGGGR